MNKNLLYWGVGSFIYFKAAFDATFDDSDSMSIMAAALFAGMVAASVHWLNGWYNLLVTRYVESVSLEKLSQYWLPNLIPLSVGLIVNLVAGKIILFAFSKKLNEAVHYDVYWSGYGDIEGWFLYLCIVLIPLIAHYLLIMFAVRASVIKPLIASLQATALYKATNERVD